MKFLVSVLLFLGLVWSQPIYETHRACVIGQNNTYYGGAIWLYNDITSGWAQIQGLAKKASFDFDGGLYVMNNLGQVYERIHNGGWGNYGTVPGFAVDICAHSGALGVIAASTNGIYQRSGSGWSLMHPLTSVISIAAKGYAVYALRIDGTVCRYEEGYLTVLPPMCVPGAAYDISVSGLGDVYVAARNISGQDYLYKYNNNGTWTQTSNTSKAIDISMVTAQGLSKSVVGGSVGAWWFLSLDYVSAYNSMCPAISMDSDVAVGLEYGIARSSVKRAIISDFGAIEEAYQDSVDAIEVKPKSK